MSTQPNPSTISDPEGVNRQLNKLGLSVPILASVVNAAAAGRLGITALHPRTSGGFMQWADGVAALREELIPLGWYQVDFQNQGLTANKQLGIVLAVAGGDEDTGVEKGKPTTRAKRGPATKRNIDANAGQLEMFPEYFERPQEIRDDEYGVFWLLLIHVDQDSQEVRSELSRPFGWRSDRRPSGLDPRLILPTLPIDGDMLTRNGKIPSVPQTPEINIEIKRRA